MEETKGGISASFIAANINQTHYNCEWHKDAVAFGSASQVCLYSPKQNKIKVTLSGHNGRVNTLTWAGGDSDLLVSGASNGEVFVWENPGGDLFDYRKWQKKHEVKVLDSIVQVGATRLSNGTHLVAILSIKSVVFLYHLAPDGFKFVESVSFGNNIVQRCCFFTIPGASHTYIALAPMDPRVHLYQLRLESIEKAKELPKEREELEVFIYRGSIAGHEDRVMSISTICLADGSVYLATGSRDCTIRVYSIRKTERGVLTSKHKTNAFGLECGSPGISHVSPDLPYYWITLESILTGHSEAITHISFMRKPHSKVSPEEPKSHLDGLQIASCSGDYTVQISELDTKHDIWQSVARLGQIAGNRNSFMGLTISPDHNSILGYTVNGSPHLWVRADLDNDWQCVPGFTGHFGPVKDLDWASKNEFFVTVSSDQTTRIWSMFDPVAKNSKEESQIGQWFEVSRAQIHGYDINAVKTLKIDWENGKTRSGRPCDLILSGADEKIIRIFEPTPQFANHINKFNRNAQLRLFFPDELEEIKVMVKNQSNTIEYQTVSEAGSQILGLLTKQVQIKAENFYYGGAEEGEEEPAPPSENLKEEPGANQKAPINGLIIPENQLSSGATLWPEMNKLYGHQYEISALATTKDGVMVASASRSLKKDQAGILLWNPKTYQISQRVLVHSSTIFQLDFSPDDQHLAAVSRDRSISLYSTTKSEKTQSISLVAHLKEAHSRMVLCCGFSPDSKVLATGGRDKLLKFWSISEINGGKETAKPFAQLELSSTVTAVSFCPVYLKNNYIVAVGLETGLIEVFQGALSGESGSSLERKLRVPEFIGHGEAVNRIKFNAQGDKGSEHCFASCSDDRSVRVFSFSLSS